jgi:hypothetical protein
VTVETRPEPLVAAHVDLNGYEFMPLHGEKLRTSSLNTDPDISYEAKWAALQLWWSSWWQVPAASLPNKELELAALAGCRSVRAWSRVRAAALRKWVLCSDDRWYHPFLADLAVAAFSTRKSQSKKGKAGAEKRWGNKGTHDAPANASAIGTNGSGNGTGNASATKRDSTGNSNRSEVNTPLPPKETPTSTPRAASHSLARAEQTKREMADAAARATPPPGGSAAEFMKNAIAHIKPPHQPSSQPFEDDAP